MGVTRDRFPRHSRAITKTKRWRLLRLEIIDRDGGRCTSCGSMRRLEVHHVKPVRDRPDLAYAPENLRTLCASCHTKITRIEVGHRPPDPRLERWRGLVDELDPSSRRNPKCSIA